MKRTFLRIRRAGWILLIFAICVQASAAPADAHKAGEIVIETGSAQDSDGNVVHYEIGTLYVSENRHSATSRVIAVGFARIKAPRSTRVPPLFVLPGGPGNSLLDTFTDKSAKSRSRLKAWSQYSAMADLVVVDQRGYSLRGERLALFYAGTPLDLPASITEDTRHTIAFASAAVAANTDKDLSGYNVIECAEDVNALRTALGYKQITLLGTSFGSQWSFALMRQHPQIVARAMLSGVEPLDYGYDMPSHVVAALQRIAFDADRDPGLAAYLPPGGLMGAVETLIERFRREPPLPVTVTDEKSSHSQTVILGLEDFQSALASHSEHAENWPAFVLALYYKHYEEWAKEVIEQRKGENFTLISALIDTSLGVTPAREHQLRTDPAIGLLGTWNFDSYLASATAWPSPDVGDSFRQPIPTAIPVLFVQGDWDTSTPVENTLNMLPYFFNSRLILVHRGGHDGPLSLLKAQPELKSGALEFLRTGQMPALHAMAELPVPAFKLPAFIAPAENASGSLNKP